jgi:hypothetical protein
MTTWTTRRFTAVRVAAHAHLVHLLQSPQKTAEAWDNLQAILSARYGAADEVVTAIRHSGLLRDQLGSDVLRYAFDELLELVRGPEKQEIPRLVDVRSAESAARRVVDPPTQHLSASSACCALPRRALIHKGW